MIQVESLTKRYGDRTAVDDLSFEVQPGKVTGFLGPNGAGKSTTMRMILGLDRPTSGRTTVAGRAIHRPARRAAARRRTARRRRGPGRPPRRRAPARRGRHPRPGQDPGRGGAREVGLEQVARQRIGSFSLGMRQRLGIAPGAARRPARRDARRTHQRPRSGRRAVDSAPAALARRPGPHRVRFLAPDVRGRADRRPPRRHRQEVASSPTSTPPNFSRRANPRSPSAQTTPLPSPRS